MLYPAQLNVGNVSYKTGREKKQKTEGDAIKILNSKFYS